MSSFTILVRSVLTNLGLVRRPRRMLLGAEFAKAMSLAARRNSHLVILTLALLTGCNAPPSTTWSISGDFAPEEVSAIKAAAYEWTEAGHPIILSDTGDNLVIKREIACEETNAGCLPHPLNSYYVVIGDRPLIRSHHPDWLDHVRGTALHEWGHWLGLTDQYDTPDCVMYYKEQLDMHVTEEDLRRLGDNPAPKLARTES